MPEIIIEDGIEREVIKIACDNEQGFRLGYRDTLGTEYQEYVEGADAASSKAAKAPKPVEAPIPPVEPDTLLEPALASEGAASTEGQAWPAADTKDQA